MTFEEKVKRLEDIVAILETGNATLEEINKLFAEGVELAKDCFTTLNNSKGKITVLQQELSDLVEKPFDVQ